MPLPGSTLNHLIVVNPRICGRKRKVKSDNKLKSLNLQPSSKYVRCPLLYLICFKIESNDAYYTLPAVKAYIRFNIRRNLCIKACNMIKKFSGNFSNCIWRMPFIPILVLRHQASAQSLHDKRNSKSE